MTALLLLTHQPAPCVNRMAQAWRELTNPEQIVIAYGGPESEFPAIEGTKAFITDPRLRTRDHQREKQSYTGMLQAAVALLADQPWDCLYLAEYDMLPIAADLFTRLRDHADHERADLLGHRAWRVDDTLHPHYSNHLAATRWLDWVQEISVREDKSVVLSCMGCGQWWRREALEAVLALGEPVPAYLELHLPTVAHHIGFRVRGISRQDPFIRTKPYSPGAGKNLANRGAWLIHPDKTLWE
jgi:hypothetical protein